MTGSGSLATSGMPKPTTAPTSLWPGWSGAAPGRPTARGKGRHDRGHEDENAFLESHSWDEYAEWHLGLTEGAAENTKARYAFVYGDFRRIHRMGLIACHYRAAEWRHKEIELAAHELLQLLDETSAGKT